MVLEKLRKLRSKLNSPLRGLPRESVDAIRLVRREGLTYLSEERLGSLVRLCVETEQDSGVILEAGCALGGSAIVLAATKNKDARLVVYDVFDQIPPPSERDGEDVHQRYEVIVSGSSVGLNGDQYYGYQTGLYEKVRQSFSRLGYPIDDFNVSLVKGLVEETLPDPPSESIRLAHIDVDWYDPVMTCLKRIVPHLSEHGAVVLDDYGDWSGCRKAVDDYFDRVGRDKFTFDLSVGHLIVRRRGN